MRAVDVTIAKTIDRHYRMLLANQKMGRRIGFVPTMGSLHAGHTSLVDRAMAE